jgi:cytochrome c oxidase subunit 6b
MSEVSTADIKTAAVDMRFPSTNQARTCYTRYNEYYKCLQLKGDDCADCVPFKKAALSLCPMDWIEKWEDARENGEHALLVLPAILLLLQNG